MRGPLVTLVLATLLLPGLAAAQSADQGAGDGDAPSKGGGQRSPEQMRQQFAARFKKADTNGDGKLSRAEAQAGMPMVARNFDAIDTNKDGFVTPEELRAAMQKRREQTQSKDAQGNAGSAASTDDVDAIPK